MIITTVAVIIIIAIAATQISDALAANRNDCDAMADFDARQGAWR